MHRGRPSVRHQHGIARDHARTARRLHRPHARPSACGGDAGAEVKGDPRRACLSGQCRIDRAAPVQDRGHRGPRLGPRLGQREGDVPGAIMRRVNNDPAAGQDAVTVRVYRRRAGHHDARPVVAGKHHGPLDRARRDDDAFRPCQPQPFARQIRVGRGQMIGDPFHEGDHVTGIPAERRCPGQQPHARVQRRRDPVPGRNSIDPRLWAGQ